MQELELELNKILTIKDKSIFVDMYNKNITYYKVDKDKLDRLLYEKIITTDFTAIDRKTTYLLSIVKKLIETNDLKRKDNYNELVVKKIEYKNNLTINLTDLLNSNDFKGSLETYARILLIETHAIRNFPINENDMVDTNYKIVEYLKSKNKTYELFEICLMKSKIMEKVATPIDILKEKAKIIIKFDKLIREIGGDRQDIKDELKLLNVL